MKKIFLFFLTLSLVMSMISAPASVFAENKAVQKKPACGTITEINFDTEAQKHFYSDLGDGKRNYTEAEFIESNDGNSMRLFRVASTNVDGYPFYCSSVMLCDNSGTAPQQLESGTVVNISVNAAADGIEEGWHNVGGENYWMASTDIRLGLVFGKYFDNALNSKEEMANGIKKYVSENKFFDLGNFEWGKPTKLNAEKQITVPDHEADEYPIVIFYTNKEIKDNLWTDAYIKHIKLEKLSTNSSVINFETQEQKDYYTVDNKTNMYNADIVNDGENTVVNFKQYAALIANSWENDDFARWGAALKINEANDGKLTAGSKISVSVDVKPGTIDNGKVGIDNYYIGIAFTNEPDLDDLGGESSDKNKNGLRKISSEGKLVDIDMIDIDNKAWQTASSEITVPENIGADEYAALVIYRKGDAWGHLKGSIYVDNIKLTNQDVNGDKTTDICDLVSLNCKNIISESMWSGIDVNADGVCDFNDLADVRRTILAHK